MVKDPNYYDAARSTSTRSSTGSSPTSRPGSTTCAPATSRSLDRLAADRCGRAQADAKLRLLTSDSLGYQGITINLGNLNGVGKPPAPLAAPYASPIAADVRVRRAFELSLDRAAINQVVFRGQYQPGLRPDQLRQPVLLATPRRPARRTTRPRPSSCSPRPA